MKKVTTHNLTQRHFAGLYGVEKFSNVNRIKWQIPNFKLQFVKCTDIVDTKRQYGYKYGVCHSFGKYTDR